MSEPLRTERTMSDRYSVKPFKHISVGDPSYWGDKSAEKLTINKKYPVSNREASVIITNTHREYEGNDNKTFGFDEIGVTIASYKKDGWFAKYDGMTVHSEENCFKKPCKRTTLGCDTARFEMEIDGRLDTIQTGADGIYGDCYCYADNEAIVVSVFVDADMCSEQKMRDTLAYLLDCPEISKANQTKDKKPNEKDM